MLTGYLSFGVTGFALFKFQDTEEQSVSNPNLFPVMIYIHGGGWTMGSSHSYPGVFLAERKVVVVTFNYRLNALGRYFICYNLFKILFCPAFYPMQLFFQLMGSLHLYSLVYSLWYTRLLFTLNYRLNQCIKSLGTNEASFFVE